MSLDTITVKMDIPHDVTIAEVETALRAVGASNVRVYKLMPPTERPMHHGYPE